MNSATGKGSVIFTDLDNDGNMDKMQYDGGIFDFNSNYNAIDKDDDGEFDIIF